MAKRSHGEGTVRKRTLKRDDGTSYVRYFAVITNGNQTDGSQKRLEGPWRKTRPEANRDRIELLKQLEQGMLNRAGDSCLSDYLDYWLEQRQHDLRPRSMQAYRGDSKNHVKPYLGNIKLNKLTPLHVQSWQTELLKNNSAYVTRKARACLSAALTQAVQWQVIPVNPVDAVAAVRMPDNDIQVWEPCEVRMFLAEAQAHRFYATYFLTLSLGLRLGEVRGLQWSDINGNTLHVQRTLSGDKAVPKFGPPKTRKGDRLLPIPPDVLSVLNDHRQVQEATRAEARKGWQDYDLVFTTGRGTPPSRARLVEPFEKLSLKADVSGIRFHDLRHTAASLWIASGMDVATVSARLGHSDINTTLRIYAHAFRSRLEQSSRTMEELLSSL